MAEDCISAAFQGERGAFSEEAARRYFGPSVRAVPCRDFDQLFQAVVTGTTQAAVVPIENTLAGSIIKNYDLLLEHDVTITGEVVLRVVHNLIGLAGTTVEEIRRVHSHPAALAQCERFLREHPAMEAVAAYDTAGSVKMVVEAGHRHEAAIAGADAAVAWGAEILAAEIESDPHNFTRFVIVIRPDQARPRELAADPTRAPRRSRKTSLVFRTAHRPGGLHAALAAFAERGVNLTKIESRPIPGRPWEYSFYLDLLGDPAEPAVAEALAHLQASAESVRVLGTYLRAEMPDSPAASGRVEKSGSKG
jgi:prephenate dehydratase